MGASPAGEISAGEPAAIVVAGSPPAEPASGIGDARRLAVAPMMDCTDRHARYLLRLITRRTLLYTEMLNARALLQGDAARLLAFHGDEHPVALQLGGSDPALLARAARIGAAQGYDEINLNVGCPSPRVRDGRFGACLMAEPDIVAECIAAMRAACSVPVTVKCRTGLDQDADARRLHALVEAVRATGCDTFVVHARNAWLHGLSPRENRTVPPLRYELVHALKAQWPALTVVINGGINTLAQAQAELGQVDGVMMGRAAYHTPWVLAQADPLIFDAPAPATQRGAVLDTYLGYAARQHCAGVPRSILLKPLHGLYDGLPGARRWRRTLTEAAQDEAVPWSRIVETAPDEAPEPAGVPAHFSALG